MITLQQRNEIARLMQLLDPNLVLKAQRETLTGVRNRSATVASRAVRQRYYVSAGAISRRLKMGFRDSTRMEAHLIWIGERIGLINFNARPKVMRTTRGKRRGATFQMLRNRGRVNSNDGFIATGRNGNTHIFKRKDVTQKGRLPIKRLTGPAIPQMVGGPDVQREVELFVAAEYPAQLLARMDRFFQAGGAR